MDEVLFKASKDDAKEIIEALIGHANTLSTRAKEETFQSMAALLRMKAARMNELAELIRSKLTIPTGSSSG